MNRDMEQRGTIEIFTKTMPMVLVRMVADIIKTVTAFLAVGLTLLIGSMITKSSHGKFDPTMFYVIAGIIVMLVIYTINHWVMYLVKAGHVAVIAYYMQYGCLPKEGQIEYAKKKVKENFISTNVGFGFDNLITGATNEAVSFLNDVENFLSFVPGIGIFMSVVKFFVRTVTNYVDEAVMAYIYMSNDNSNVWRKTADGIVLYVQNWKTIFKASAKVGISILLLKGIMLFMMIGILAPHFGQEAFILQVIGAILIWMFITSALIEPIVVVIMIKDYIYACSQSTVAYDLYQDIQDCSAKFRKIVEKATYY